MIRSIALAGYVFVVRTPGRIPRADLSPHYEPIARTGRIARHSKQIAKGASQ